MTDKRAIPTQPSLAERAPRTEALVRWLDSYGLDALSGFLVPIVGDVLSGAASLAVLVTAIREGVPTVILFRMLLNILIDVIVGAVPVLGDLFDFAWRANRKNWNLVDEYRGGTMAPSVVDYLIVGLSVTLLVAAIVLPFFWLSKIWEFFAS